MNELQQFLENYEKTRPKKQPKPPYKKPASVRQLEDDVFEQKRLKHPDVPFLLKHQYRDDSANGLTACVVAWLQLHGYFAGRINVTGTYSKKLGKYIHSGSRRGMADITAIIGGKHVSVEIKHGHDKMREAQLKVKHEVEQAGGVYIVASTFDDFLEKINKHLII